MQKATASSLDLPEIYLHAGQMWVSPDALLLSMILGSCVAVCLFDHERLMGGATHFLLPDWRHAGGQPSTRYGNVAIASLLKQLKNQGCATANLTAKIFGGACMFDSFRDSAKAHIGERNAAIALETLYQLSIPVVAKDIGGDCGRKIKMWTRTGEVLVELVGA
jgi:chemotaxis protein CheD